MTEPGSITTSGIWIAEADRALSKVHVHDLDPPGHVAYAQAAATIAIANMLLRTALDQQQ
ncbi:MAG TPA: hypothetical protein VEX40_01895 [Mycobacterium sp.]|nr:hypothetical protein [Mycobacterium sp.]